MATDKMLSEIDAGIGRMIFNNPERRNAVSLEMWEAAEEILRGFAENPEVRVVVLSGAGGRAFVSGADISKFESERSSEAAIRHYNARVGTANAMIETLPKPTIAEIDGYCVGGGLGLALCCDPPVLLGTIPLRAAGRQARPGLRVRRAEAPRRYRRPGGGARHRLLRPHDPRRGSL